MSDSQADSGPPLLRPIPRRPFYPYREPTPPEDGPFTPPPPPDPEPNATLNLESLNSRLLDPMNNRFAPESAPISRAQSSLNLTGSTLMGIYSQTPFEKDRIYTGGDELGTPWGTGAETPAKNLNADSPYREIQKERAQLTRRRSSLHPVIHPQPLSTSQGAFYLGSRGLFLYGLGVLYGMSVAQLRVRQPTGTFRMDDVLPGGNGRYDWRFMTFWGISAVVMGSLLPWFDNIWERAFGGDEEAIESAGEHSMGADHAESESSCSTDWPLAVRGIGAFIGIAFAIRKLPWDSTLQVSLTLALVNPVLWFLIDRSMPGFVLSTVVGLAGSAVLLGLKPEMVPTPANPSMSAFGTYSEWDNVTSGVPNDFGHQQQLVSFGGLTISQETLATGIWVMSILFCCCVCFGNIGRWLALNRGAAARGRWAERR